jgi:putative mRNA 3-end processing factor
MSGIDRGLGRIYTHGSVERLTAAYRDAGVDLPETRYAGDITDRKEFAGSLIVAPPSAQASTWLRRFGPQSTGFASGWMMVRGARRQRAIDRGFVLSDHADWPELLTAIKATDAETVYVTHGFAREMVRYLNEVENINAVPLKTQFAGDDATDTLEEEEV